MGWIIYALCSPTTGAVRYVGYTANAAVRLRRHIATARADAPAYPVHRWIKGLLNKGRIPALRVLETNAHGRSWQEAERDWIARHSNTTRLLNVAPGGHEAYVSPAARERARAKLRQRVFTPEHRARISAAKTGVPRTDSTKVAERLRAVAKANLGKKMVLSDAERARRREAIKAASAKRWANHG